MFTRLLRKDHSRSESTSCLAPSVTEAQRLDMMHAIHTSVLGLHHSEMIAKHLACVHAEGRRSKVLDVGTGTGTWSVSLANAQPFSDVVAVDNDWSCFRNGVSTHGNVDFSTVNVSEPLPFCTNQFDLIHVKCLLLDVPRYSQLLERLAVILRPGGMLVCVECEPTYLSATGQVGHSLRQWTACVREAYAAAYNITTPARLVPTIAGSGVFASQVYCTEIGVPTTDYMRGNSRTIESAGRMHQQVIAANMRKIMPRLLEHGYGLVDVERMMAECLAELCGPGSKHYQRLFSVYAKKVKW